jgi:2-polyprenyl-6-methoxyphenol hydroxylase-like FAD-dependent oxidoreductase
MIPLPNTRDVLIVGAGPTGLSMAPQCLRYGLSFVNIDGKDSPTELSKALVVHARTLEIYDQTGWRGRPGSRANH